MDEAAPTREWGSLVDVLISVDMKGVAGIATRQQTNPGGRDYPIARALMTAEAKAAVAGAFDGGATSVVVNDSHGPMDDLLGEQLDPRADYVKAFPGVVTVPVKTALGRTAARSKHPGAPPPALPPRGRAPGSARRIRGDPADTRPQRTGYRGRVAAQRRRGDGRPGTWHRADRHVLGALPSRQPPRGDGRAYRLVHADQPVP